MFKISASTKYLDLSKSIKIYYILAIGIFLTILSLALYQDVFIFIILTISTATAFYIFRKSPENIIIQMDQDMIDIRGELFGWNNVIEWAMVDLGHMVEFVVLTNPSNPNFNYFYMKKDQPGLPEFVDYISQNAAYNEETPSKDILHSVLRRIGLS